MICREHNIDCDNANENGYCKTSACVNPKFVVTIYPKDMENYIGDKSKAFHFEEIEESRWHTGTPTEEGYYLVHLKKYYYKDTVGYIVAKWERNGWRTINIGSYWNLDEEIDAWQKIELHEEEKKK